MKERDFKSFIILENYSYKNTHNVDASKGVRETIEYNGEKIIVQNHFDIYTEEFLDFEFLWETSREITSEIIDDKSGEILYEIDFIKKVAQISVWVYKDLPYLIVFIKGIAPNKVVKMLGEYFSDSKLSRISFEEDFFNLLIKSNQQVNIVQTTIKSASTEQEFSISGLINKNNYSLTDGFITELQIEIPSIWVKAKLSNLGRVALYNTPSLNNVHEFIKILGDSLISLKSMRRD